MMASLLLPMPLLPDEFKSSDSNILMSFKLNESTAVLTSSAEIESNTSVGIDAVGDAGPSNISTDAIAALFLWPQNTGSFSHTPRLGFQLTTTIFYRRKFIADDDGYSARCADFVF